MWLQKRLNKRLIKRAIWSEYVYEIEVDEKMKRWYSDDEENRSGWLTWFLKDWVEEMKKEVSKKFNE